jgi:hypothetical protein
MEQTPASSVPPEATAAALTQDFTPQHPIQHPPQNVLDTVDALIRRGKGPGAAQAATINAPYLLDLMPELTGVPDGPKFDSMLYNKFQSVGHELSAKMDSIPGDKPVATSESVSKLNDIADRAAQSYQTSEANAIKKVANLFDEGGTTSWKQIAEIKRNLFDKLDITTGPGKEAYQVFKDLTEKVDPTLAKLNRDWFTLKTSTELAGMDPGGMKANGELRTGGGTRPKAEAQARIDAAKAAKKAAEDAAKQSAKDAEKAAKDANKPPVKTEAEKAAERDAKVAERAKKIEAAKKLRAEENARQETKRRAEKLASDAAAAKEPPNRPIRGGRL